MGRGELNLHPAILAAVFVPGLARPKGSMTHRGGGQMANAPGVDDWVKLVAERVSSHRHIRNLTEPHPGPVGLVLRFWLPLRSRRIVVATPPEDPEHYAPIWTRSGDLDKLERGVLDGLTKGRAYVDDRVVTEIHSVKLLTSLRRPAGVGIIAYASPLSRIGESSRCVPFYAPPSMVTAMAESGGW